MPKQAVPPPSRGGIRGATVIRDLFQSAEVITEHPSCKHLADIVGESLSDVLADVDCADPVSAIWARMRLGPRGGFGWCWNTNPEYAPYTVFGFDVQGCGATQEEAVQRWLSGARAKVGNEAGG